MRELEGARGLAHTHMHMHAPLRPAPITHPLTTHPPTHRSLHSPPRHSHAHTPLTTHHALHHPPRNSPKPYTLGHACPHPVMPALVTLSYSCMHARTTNTQYICTHTWRAHTHTPCGHACPHPVMPAPTRTCLPPLPQSYAHACIHECSNARARTRGPCTRGTLGARTRGACTRGPCTLAHAPEAHAPKAHMRTTHKHTHHAQHTYTHAHTHTMRARAHHACARTHTHTHTPDAPTHTHVTCLLQAPRPPGCRAAAGPAPSTPLAHGKVRKHAGGGR